VAPIIVAARFFDYAAATNPVLKIIKKYLGKCFSSPRRLGGGKMPNVDPSHLIHGI
jgi:hypothetical protein